MSFGNKSSAHDAKRVFSYLDACISLLSSYQGSQTERSAVGNSQLFIQFFHLGAINRQRVRLTTLPTSQGRKAKALFLNVRQHAEKTNTGCNYNALKHRDQDFIVSVF